jgi:hypothetical protein
MHEFEVNLKFNLEISFLTRLARSPKQRVLLMKNERANTGTRVEGKKILNLYEIIQIITKFQLKSNLPRFPSLLLVYAYVSLHLSRLIYQRNDILSNNFSLYFPHCTSLPSSHPHLLHAVVLSNVYTHKKIISKKYGWRCMRKN